VLHGALSCGPVTDAGKARIQDGVAKWRERQRARIVLGLAPKFPSGRKSNAEPLALARARAVEVPEWPRGATGDLATFARKFMEQLYDPTLLSPQVRSHELPAALARTRQLVVNRLAEIEAYASLAALAGHPSTSSGAAGAAREAIMARVRWEVARFLDQLDTASQIAVLLEEKRQADEQERAKAMSRQVMTAGLAAGARKRGDARARSGGERSRSATVRRRSQSNHSYIFAVAV